MTPFPLTDEVDKLRVDCAVEKVGEAGALAPEVESVRSRPGDVLLKFGVGLAVPLAVLDCTPTRLVLGGAPAGTTGPHFLKVTDESGHVTTFDQELTSA